MTPDYDPLRVLEWTAEEINGFAKILGVDQDLIDVAKGLAKETVMRRLSRMATDTGVAAASLFFAFMLQGETPSMYEFVEVLKIPKQWFEIGLEAVASLPTMQSNFPEVEDMIRMAIGILDYPAAAYWAALALWRTVADDVKDKAKNRQAIVVAILYLVMLEKEEIDAIERLGDMVEVVGFVTEATVDEILHVIDILDLVYGYRQLPKFELMSW
jgi:transcription initiation factor TFIIIB Brf1 subunit/transcription initiation factor TFIIB